ncbi:putative toxin-antitoxin system toxin component, PIN family [Nostoc sp. PCC 7120 = FACHB-418]|uniref:Toxin-antitoxin system toxin component, PIN family n=1 Tax=Anabaena cylindrica FACHB-318 TaxID=2692880 RepID=A0ABR7ZM05_ANACY|nr:putative toxin-antitoxin system toxin component, PIN family [Anabaena cylindrica FACHB-318]MBD2265018.1 putative toxin-antitoxin system toxin component, PIN family [Anabaena sp. FACHB-709]MBD2274328.1 putative toxin-antitoxin system toxin component, PIN family [Nostoc sp. PCC 7120 = FACHB-418]MBD2285203.1 putative toxin-antitoxin system toxin component, PIN family [Anabaena cylindrica FACHB-170]MBD2350709.1 putative toxin-antitoxin system toxin component, PIN family [Trichormus variabilis FA
MRTNERRFVFDVNVIISAVLLPGSKPESALRKAQDLGELLVSESIWLELEQVLARPKFNRYITLEERNEFLVDLSETVQFIKVTEQINECRDPKDNKYLELAVSGKAECIVTGDDDLLVLNPWRDIEILTVQEFLEKN